jgi:acetate kinase
MNTVLVLNAGSNSLKYKLFSGEVELLAGHIDGIGREGTSTLTRNGTRSKQLHYAADHAAAVTFALSVIHAHSNPNDISHVLHRVVHGGEHFREHHVITPAVEAGITELCVLAPLHNPANLAGIRAAQHALPHSTHIAFFDTAFHHTIPKQAFLYGIPYRFYEKWGIRKYGFHGLSHEHIAECVAEITQQREQIISCHLGSGSSLAAIHHGQSLDTTMGFTPLDGLLMATRSGELDPDIPLFLLEHEHLTLEQLQELLNKESGMKGLVGTGDLREIKQRADTGDETCKLVIEMLIYRIAGAIGSYHIAVGGARTIVFTGGIGEHAPYIRSGVCKLLTPIGVRLDETANAEHRAVISTPSSKITVLVIPANEELHMVRLFGRGAYTL